MGLGPTVDAFGQGMMFHTALTVEWAQNHHTFVIDMEIYILWFSLCFFFYFYFFSIGTIF